jgi:hypothetical protein
LESLTLAAIGSGAGAIGGAGIVFWLQGRKEKRERQEKEVRELRRMQFALVGRVSTLDMLWSQWLRPAKEEYGGHWAALRVTSGIIPPEPLGLERTGFILESKPQLLGDLHQSEQGFQSFLMTANRYSEWRDQAARRIEERTERDQEERTEDEKIFWTKELERLAGPFLHHQLKALADSLYERCPYLRRELMSRFDALANHIRTEYNAKPLGAVVKPPEGVVP